VSIIKSLAVSCVGNEKITVDFTGRLASFQGMKIVQLSPLYPEAQPQESQHEIDA